MRETILKHKKGIVANARIFLILSVVFVISLSLTGCGNEDEFLPESSSDFVYTKTENEHDNPMNEDNILKEQ